MLLFLIWFWLDAVIQFGDQHPDGMACHFLSLGKS